MRTFHIDAYFSYLIVLIVLNKQVKIYTNDTVTITYKNWNHFDETLVLAEYSSV